MDHLLATHHRLTLDLACAADADESAAIEAALSRVRAALKQARGW
mgnify:CR=1|jgi:hypothetical protein